MTANLPTVGSIKVFYSESSAMSQYKVAIMC